MEEESVKAREREIEAATARRRAAREKEGASGVVRRGKAANRSGKERRREVTREGSRRSETERDEGRDGERTIATRETESLGDRSMDATPRDATLSRILRSISPLRSNTMPAPTYYARHYRKPATLPLRLPSPRRRPRTRPSPSTSHAPLAPLSRNPHPRNARPLCPLQPDLLPLHDHEG